MDSEQIRNVKALRAKLDHPVIDGDGHLIEAAPLFNDYLRQVGGAELVERYHRELREHPTAARASRAQGEMRFH